MTRLNLSFDTVLKSLVRWIVAANAVVLVIAIALSIIYTRIEKERIAGQVGLNMRSAIIANDYRDAMLQASYSLSGNFDGIRLEKPDGQVRFALPPGPQRSRMLGLNNAEKTVSIHFDEAHPESGTTDLIVFTYDQFEKVPPTIAIWLLIVAASLPIFLFGYRHLRRIHELELSERRSSAVARMTQMLAHDVRKPFSILRMGLGMLGKATDPAAVKKILSGLVPEIDKAVSSVDGLIADVMEVGSNSTQLIQEPASPESLIEATLGEMFRVYPKSNISIEYDLRHTHMVNVHVQKVGRVFSNIVGNAIQAMGYKGGLWFKTRERDGLVEFCLGNAGSVIPADSLPKLFDAFFTSGKKGGTGLGLAIAQKVVTAHGGRIWAESSKTLEHPDGKVEFFFTLPTAQGARTKTTASLPNHSSDITRAIAAMAAAAETGEGSVDKGELTLEADIIQACDKLGRALRVLVIDDEAVYRGGLAAYLSRTTELEAAILLAQADGSEAAFIAVGAEGFDLIITDVDMGNDSLDGFALVRKFRAGGHAGMICVHSNRIVAADHKRAIEAGADAFLPKPMARAQLLRLVLQAVQSASVPFVDPAIESIVPR